MEMMWEYYQQHDYIMGRQICHKTGVTIRELNIGNACLNYILGLCNKKGCTETRRHPRADDPSPEEVDEFCNKLRKGVNEITRAKRHRGSSYGSSDVE